MGYNRYKQERVRVISLTGSAPQRLWATLATAPPAAKFNIRVEGGDAFVAQAYIADPANPLARDGKLVADGTTDPAAAGRVTAANCNFPIRDGENVPRHSIGNDEEGRTPYHLYYWWVDAAAACTVYVTWNEYVEI